MILESNSINLVSSRKDVEPVLTMLSLQLDMELRKELITGLLKTHGDLLGVKMDISEF